MASLLLSLSAILFTIFSLQFLIISPTLSTSRHIRVALKHIDSGKNLTKFERLQRGIMRGNLRLERLANNMKMITNLSGDSSLQVTSPVHAGSGEFLMTLAIGTPPETYSAIMDTGSDLIWTQCEPCTNCYVAPTPVFDPEKSSTFSKVSCLNSLCGALPSSNCGSDGCEYLYSYGDRSSTQGVLATETFTFDKVAVPELGFGCGEDNQGFGSEDGGGLVGLGRGPLSLLSQLNQTKFSYCLTSIDDQNAKSTLVIGSLPTEVTSTNPVFTTPFVKNPYSHPTFYYLSLVGISVGNVDLPIEQSTFAINSDGSGGMIIDSGTTLTYLKESAFDLVKKEFISQTKLKVGSSVHSFLCFELPGSGTMAPEIPKLVFHFDGASLDLPLENYMIEFTRDGVVCLAMKGSTGLSLFGNIQQQNFMVVHDLENQKLSFIPTKCDQF